MRKWISILLMAALAMTALCVPAMADIPVLSSDGVELRITRYKLYDDDNPNLRLYVYVSNDNDHQIHISGGDCVVDGTPCRALGFSIEPYGEYGDDSQSIMLVATEEDPSAGAAALRNARQIELDLKLLDDNYKTVLTQHLSISVDNNGYISTDGSGSNDGFSDDSVDDLDFGHGGSSYANTAPAYTPASTDYQTLKKGSKGQAVKDLQQRLTDLGYLNDKVDGSFGTNTGIAVMSFCTQNGLYISPEANPEMQRLLYSSNAQYYVEPYIPLVIGTEYKWTSNARNDVGRFYIQLVNRSNREIRGYEIYLYGTNMWDETIYGDNGGWLYKYEEQQTFKAGQWQNTNPLIFGSFAYTYKVWAGIHRIVFADGEIREVDFDDISWFPCQVKK